MLILMLKCVTNHCLKSCMKIVKKIKETINLDYALQKAYFANFIDKIIFAVKSACQLNRTNRVVKRTAVAAFNTKSKLLPQGKSSHTLNKHERYEIPFNNLGTKMSLVVSIFLFDKVGFWQHTHHESSPEANFPKQPLGAYVKLSLTTATSLEPLPLELDLDGSNLSMNDYNKWMKESVINIFQSKSHSNFLPLSLRDHWQQAFLHGQIPEDMDCLHAPHSSQL